MERGHQLELMADAQSDAREILLGRATELHPLRLVPRPGRCRRDSSAGSRSLSGITSCGSLSTAGSRTGLPRVLKAMLKVSVPNGALSEAQNGAQIPPLNAGDKHEWHFIKRLL